LEGDVDGELADDMEFDSKEFAGTSDASGGGNGVGSGTSGFWSMPRINESDEMDSDEWEDDEEEAMQISKGAASGLGQSHIEDDDSDEESSSAEREDGGGKVGNVPEITSGVKVGGKQVRLASTDEGKGALKKKAKKEGVVSGVKKIWRMGGK
jgi:hypothetical protein